ncbi:putative arginine and proline rich protein [Mycobacterium kansasii 662]|uniref:Putative arginine and proline rich protein n=6 Tax=Mycobacterium kansasii TaxID=1768 RepID=A0A1V3X8L5_MYCKA|nr:putative arginine and proline rich protein [Mycobacterium kansasii 824]EUA16585.1 putative arginine and proline rich protein [Mycobacterium kansasii 662]OOK72864.1 putative arginine and proline rich protein [Mycobacterium kansasii]OOK75559.1 putative arginine and proline rich protein [Mycobacterium kansasii]
MSARSFRIHAAGNVKVTAPWRSQAQRSWAQRLATIVPVAIASPAQLGAAGRHHRSRGDRKPSSVGSTLGAAGRHHRSRGDRKPSAVGSELGAAGRHHRSRGDRKPSAAGRSGSPPSFPWRSQAQRSWAQRVATIVPVAIASPAQLGAAGRHGTAQTTTDVPGEIPNTAQMLVTPAPGPATSCLTPATRPRLLARIRTGYS